MICEDWFHGRHLGRAEDDCDKDEANANRLVDPDFRYVSQTFMIEIQRIELAKTPKSPPISLLDLTILADSFRSYSRCKVLIIS